MHALAIMLVLLVHTDAGSIRIVNGGGPYATVEECQRAAAAVALGLASEGEDTSRVAGVCLQAPWPVGEGV